MGLSLLLKPDMTTNIPLEPQSGEKRGDILHLALLVDASEMIHNQATASNMNCKNHGIGHRSFVFIFLVLTHWYYSTGKCSDEGRIRTNTESNITSLCYQYATRSDTSNFY